MIAFIRFHTKIFFNENDGKYRIPSTKWIFLMCEKTSKLATKKMWTPEQLFLAVEQWLESGMSKKKACLKGEVFGGQLNCFF